MPSTNVAYAAALGIEHYFVPMRQALIDLEDAATAAANNGAALSAWLDTTKAIDGIKTLEYSGAGSTLELIIGKTTKGVTNAALQGGTATLTLDAAAGVAVGSTIKVTGLGSPFASLNGTFIVTGVTTASPFTVSYALAGTNISSASATGVVTTGIYPLDGTGAPIRLSNVTGMPLSTNTNDESVITHDQVTRGSAISIGISDTSSFAMKGMVVHKGLDNKIAELYRMLAVSEQLAGKYLRVGPAPSTEKRLGYVRLSSKQEEGDAGALVKMSATLSALGQIYTIFDNSAG